MWLFLAVAPLVPGTAVALCYDPRIEPALEHELTTPYSTMRLVLLRTLAVLAGGLPVLLVLGLLVPGSEPVPLAASRGRVCRGRAGAFDGDDTAARGRADRVGVAGRRFRGRAGRVTRRRVAAPFAAGYVAATVVSLGVFALRGRHIRQPLAARRAVMNARVELNGVGHRFGAAWALQDVDLTLSPGVIGLLGPNGAGKSTLLRIAATSLTPSTGRTRILGYDASSPSERTEIRRELGYVPQELGYPRRFTAFAFVDYVAVFKEWTDTKARHAEVRRVLELVGLTSVSAKRIRTLSGGQRRRLGVAQAPARAARLLVLDEPTTGLDPEQRAALRSTLAEIGRESVVLMATHQTEDIAALCRAGRRPRQRAASISTVA